MIEKNGNYLVSMQINGKRHDIEVSVEERLLDVLRDRLGLFGTKEGCGIGECGACTVLMDGQNVNSCMILAVQADGSEIKTIEGLKGSHGELHPIQEAFIEGGAVQCGFCTPGMIISSYKLLKENGDPSDEEIKEALSGNFCRCTGYTQVVEAVHLAADKMKK